MKKVKNFARFYAIARNFPGDLEEIKPQVVRSFTGGRTISLREMTPAEYNAMCDALESESLDKMDEAQFRAEIKRHRSAVLKRIQRLGIDTTEWANVDNFCLDPRIAGKLFRALTIEELKGLIPRLEAIRRKDEMKALVDRMHAPVNHRASYCFDDTEMIKRAAGLRPS